MSKRHQPISLHESMRRAKQSKRARIDSMTPSERAIHEFEREVRRQVLLRRLGLEGISRPWLPQRWLREGGEW